MPGQRILRCAQDDGGSVLRYALDGRMISALTVGAGVRLRCPTLSLARTPASMVDRGTHCAFALSATGSAKARGLDGPQERTKRANAVRPYKRLRRTGGRLPPLRKSQRFRVIPTKAQPRGGIYAGRFVYL